MHSSSRLFQWSRRFSSARERRHPKFVPVTAARSSFSSAPADRASRRHLPRWGKRLCETLRPAFANSGAVRSAPAIRIVLVFASPVFASREAPDGLHSCMLTNCQTGVLSNVYRSRARRRVFGPMASL